MSKRIRRTVTITITETLTIVWATGDAPVCDSSIGAPDPSTSEEERHDMLQVPLSKADPGSSRPSDPSATSPTPAAETDAQSDNVPVRATSGSRRKRTRRRRTKDDRHRE